MSNKKKQVCYSDLLSLNMCLLSIFVNLLVELQNTNDILFLNNINQFHLH